jgi:hypothetical protein
MAVTGDEFPFVEFTSNKPLPGPGDRVLYYISFLTDQDCLAFLKALGGHDIRLHNGSVLQVKRAQQRPDDKARNDKTMENALEKTLLDAQKYAESKIATCVPNFKVPKPRADRFASAEEATTRASNTLARFRVERPVIQPRGEPPQRRARAPKRARLQGSMDDSEDPL